MKEYNVTVYKPWTKEELNENNNGDNPKKRSYGTKYTLPNLLQQLVEDRASISAMDYDDIVVKDINDNADTCEIELRKDNIRVATVMATTQQTDNNSNQESDNQNTGNQEQRQTTSSKGGRDDTAPTSTQFTKGQGNDNGGGQASQQKTVRNDRPDTQASDAKSSSANRGS